MPYTTSGLINGARQVRFLDSAYAPYAGALTGVDVMFSVASNDNVQNNVGAVATSSHFMNAALDTKIDASGADKLYTGLLNQIRVAGTAYSGSPYIRGIWNYVNNRTNLLATPYIYGIDSGVSVEGHATEAVGAQLYVFKGSAVNAAKFVGVRAIAGNAYTTADEVTAVEAWSRTLNAGYAPPTTLMRGLWSHVSHNDGVVTTLRGVDISSFLLTGAGTVTTASALYIGSDTAIGSTNYAVQSDSTAPSYLSGNLSINGAGRLHLTTSQTPASASAAGTTGQVAWDANYIYICTATNTWKRTALSTW